MLTLIAAAAIAAASPDPSALSPAEQVIRNMTTRTILASPARYCKEQVRAQPGADPAPLRCRPAPYYVSARDGRRIPHVLLAGGKDATIELLDRQGRPCHLMRTPSEPYSRLRVAD